MNAPDKCHRCASSLPAGRGNQYQQADGDWLRLCDRCDYSVWQEWEADRIALAQARADNQGREERNEEMPTC